MLHRRLQISLDEQRYQLIVRAAKRRGASMAAVAREATDRLADESDRRRAALNTILAAEPIPVPEDPADLRQELDAAHKLIDR